LFSRSSRIHFVLTGRLLVAYVGVSVLHGLWDSMPNIAVLITLLMTGRHYQYDFLLRTWILAPTPTQVRLYTVLDWSGLALIAGLGILWLWVMTKQSRQELPTERTSRSYRIPRSGRRELHVP
jgi:hypothetical protein